MALGEKEAETCLEANHIIRLKTAKAKKFWHQTRNKKDINISLLFANVFQVAEIGPKIFEVCN